MAISTHTPLAGRDPQSEMVWISANGFLLTRPSRGVTELKLIVDFPGNISTHTPLAGRDEY